ncbi:MAG TPA: DUF420 domain-containing protein, partial [Gemmataceae bacterium]|nr:DUF420 domain-containing protein [Gemmataceae bacterium]
SSGRTVTRHDLEGKVWVASFIFTRCRSTCPQISATLLRLQAQLAKEHARDVLLVSFSVDPQHDTPAVLRAFAEQHQADPNRWLFLTGDRDKMYDLIQKGFHLGVQEAEGAEKKPGFEYIHSTRLALVDQKGIIRGYFDGRLVDDEGQPADDLPRLRQRIDALRGGPGVSLPAVNAFLNTTCTVLLVLGFLAIRRRQIVVHKTCMLAALAVSALFLASYLYYHLVVRHGQATYFAEKWPQAPDWVRYLYYVVLSSHTLLAMAAAPLALVTAFLGLSNRLRGHVRVARWALPIWLYVSVTGVVVYWMLYRLYPAP